MKRNWVYNLSIPQFPYLLSKIRSLHTLICKDIELSYRIPNACDDWIKRQNDRKLPYQEKHVRQHASILGNLEDFGVLSEKYCQSDLSAVVEFGAGGGYLTQILADFYGINKVFLVERKAYKLKLTCRKKLEIKILIACVLDKICTRLLQDCTKYSD
ncbi:uncharacterized protein LOC110683053 isoform X3 [Chenopodium quinoa]|uniref:uncharacterized protein LOC110683053 isoform X3 n=1 Tax=Chenopodium quinoa TaxID=63459 RepID=UPI000B773741|nr:uncharacterized protein LOC110683053 isoform X3 [Chenopodium quinoa]